MKDRHAIVGVGIWGDNAAVPYPVELHFTADAGGATEPETRFVLTVEQARQLARDVERTCRRIRKLHPLPHRAQRTHSARRGRGG